MGTLIAVYLLIALAVGLLFFGSVTYSALFGKLPFGMSDAAVENSAANLNASANDMVLVAGVQLGSAILLLTIFAMSVYIGLGWPVPVFYRLAKWVRK